ncbi:MAG: exosortase A [Gammaproteobacteria bacterium]
MSTTGSAIPLGALSREWRHTLWAVAAVVLLLLGVYFDTASEMVNIWWRSETFAHGFLIVPISGYLIWRQADQVMPLQPRPTWWGIPPIVMVSLLWWLAEVSGTAVISQFAFTALIPLTVLTLVGPEVAKRLWFPLAYLVFAVPAGEGLIQPMMDFTAVFTVKALELTGIPVYWEGRYIAIPKGNFEVAEACSGVRYLIASMALGALYAHLTYRSLWRQAAFLLLAALVPIIANGIRAYGIVMIAHLSDMKLAVGADHLIYGWLFFGLVMFILFAIGSIWQEDLDAPATDQGVANTRVGGAMTMTLAIPLVAVSVLLGPLLDRFASDSDAAGQVAMAEFQPAHGWQLADSKAPDWSPRFLGVADEQRHSLSNGQATVELYMGVYARQRQGVELLNFSNRFYDPDRWLRLGEQSLSLKSTDSETRLNEIHVQRPGGRGLIWHGYEIAGVSTTNPLAAKLLEAWNRLAVNRPSRVMAVYTDYDLREEEARRVLRAFMAANGEAIQAAFSAADRKADRAESSEADKAVK